MSDLTERLRKASFQEWQEYPSAHVKGAKWPVTSNIGQEAADEIDRLTRELAEAREALANDYVLKPEAWDGCQKSIQRARDKALEEAAGVVASLSFPESTGAPLEDALIRIGEIVAANAAAAIRALKEKP